jgi:predicted nucleic acid-binding protein
MTAVIADTDILSTFGKVARLDLLRQLFQHIYVAPAVRRELQQAERMGFPWVDRVTPVVELLPLTTDESQEVERLVRQHPQLGSGEVESFVLAQTHHLLCLTNDRQAKAVAKSLSLSYLDVEEILRALKTKAILATEALTALIDQIEQKDRTRIKAKEDILNN